MSSKTLRKGYVVAGVLSALAAVGYAGLLAALYFGQERLLFPATPLPADYQFQFDQRFEEIRIPVSGGSLDALLFRQPAPRGLVFYLHGNRGDLNTWTAGLDFYRRINYDLFILDYRGYGKSTGTIESEEQLHADVRAAWDVVSPRYRDLPIVIFGRSLGTGFAALLARDVHPALLVLVTPFANMAAAAKRRYPLAPEFLLKYPLRTDAVIGDVTSPVLLVAGTQDRLTPLADSLQLQSLTRAPVELLVVDGAGHVNIHRYPAYLDGLAERMIRAAGGRGQSATMGTGAAR
jgi:pimeloyl-ACP methyl ester carboxylesterase